MKKEKGPRVKVTLERLVCDVCQEDGARYTIAFPDGTKILDRCEKHAKKIIALRDEVGDWSPLESRKSGIEVVTVAEVAARRKASNGTRKKV